MNRMFLFAIIPILCLSRCNQKDLNNTERLPGDSISLKYARGFSIVRDSVFTRIHINTPYQGAKTGITYLLVPKGSALPPHNTGERIIRTPVTSIVCTSTTHIPLLDYLGETDKLIGFPTTDYISSTKMRQRIDDGKVAELGVDKGMNIEVLASLEPELLLAYTMTGEYGQFKKIEELGIPVVINAEYLEAHPLGRAEWIKFVGAFFDKLDEADSVFSTIEESYNQTRQTVEGLTERPTVLTGIMYGDAWFLPGGKNYGAKLLEDAGYHYLWETDSTSGYLQLSFELVLAKAHDVDFWIGIGPYASLKELESADQRYTKFKAFETGNVFGYDARRGSKGGNEYLELGYLRPDLILKDLVKIAHPSKLPEHQLYFHRRIN